MAKRTSSETEAQGGDSAETVVIKKYENRRLYDTSASSYVNLERVAQLVREGRDVQVVEAKGGRDVTRQVLTQIIVENSRDRDGGPPLEFLKQLVRASDRAHRDFFEWYLGSAAEVYRGVRGAWDRAYRREPAGRIPDWTRLWGPTALAGPLSQILSGGLQRTRRGAPSHAGVASAGKDDREAPVEDDLEDQEPEAADDPNDAVDDPARNEGADEGVSQDLEELSELKRRLEQLEKRLSD